MPRLIDDIRAAGKLEMPFFVTADNRQAWKETAGKVWEMLAEPKLPVILIDNVADYYYLGEQEYWDLRKDFPNLAPPWPQFWAEHRLPKTIHSAEKGDSNMAGLIGGHARAGVLVTAVAREDVKGEGIPDNVRWILWCELFIQYDQQRPVVGPHGSMLLAMDEHGAIVDTPWMQGFAAPEDAALMRAHMTWLHPTFLAICFLHCKNVVVESNEMPKPLAKKFRQKHPNLQPAPYKTLVIEPLKQILRSQGRSGEVGLAKAMHICRGHFRDYREGRGLFGKYKQLVWTPMTVRGTKGKEAPPREARIKV